MTTSTDFAPDEWETVREAPTSAGMIVSSAERGGSFREVFAMAKAYTEARQQQGDSELLDAIVSEKPDVDRTKSSSPEQLKAHGLQHIRDAVALVEQKATTVELGEYRSFVVSLAERVAAAKGDVGEAESAAIEEIKGALGA